MADYYTKRSSLIVLESILRTQGWKIYGYKEDKSDSMSDYFDPARWEGIAAKNGFILVVDNNYSGKIGGSFIRESYDVKAMKRIKKLEALRDCPSASIGEKTNAQTMIEKIMGSATITTIEDTGLPEVTYQANPKNSYWHIEKDGRILAKGNGVFGFAQFEHEIGKFSYSCHDESRYHYTDSEQYNYDVGYNSEWSNNYGRWGTSWDNERYPFEKWRENVINERAEKTAKLDKLFSLVQKLNNLAVVQLGDGEEGELEKRLITKTTPYFVAEVSESPTDYVMVGTRWRRFAGLEKGKIYKVYGEQGSKTVKKLTKSYKKLSNGEYEATYKPEPNGSTKPHYFSGSEKDFENKDILYIKLVEKLDTYTEEVWVKRATKATPKTKKLKTKEVKSETVSNDVVEEFEILLETSEVVDFNHTKTGETLKVLKIAEKLDTNRFIAFNKYLTANGIAYYSRYAKGFVVKNLEKIKQVPTAAAVVTASTYSADLLATFANGTLF